MSAIADYKRDLTVANERTTPLRCMACRKRDGIIWRGDSLLCSYCDAASEPVELDWPTVAAALMVPAPGKPVVSARTADEALQRSARAKEVGR